MLVHSAWSKVYMNRPFVLLFQCYLGSPFRHYYFSYLSFPLDSLSDYWIMWIIMPLLSKHQGMGVAWFLLDFKVFFTLILLYIRIKVYGTAKGLTDFLIMSVLIHSINVLDFHAYKFNRLIQKWQKSHLQFST